MIGGFAGAARSGIVIWITGRPSAGKSSLALRLKDALRNRCCLVLDGDAVRSALRPTPGYAPEARADFYATLTGLARLCADQGMIVLVPATAAERSMREAARSSVRTFLEIYVDTSREECERRDSKGLYAAARQGHVAHLPGMDAPYEPPLCPEVVAHGGEDEAAILRVVELVNAMP